MIYLLEDDDSIRKLIVYTLNSQGMESIGFEKPSDFWKEMESKKPDLILLDIMLPEEDGLSILKKLRTNKNTSFIPVIMLTARASEYDVVCGLDLGADDYITKPFGMMSLVARIKAVLRRYDKNSEENINSSKELVFEKICLNKAQHTVHVEGKQIFLTVKEFDVLEILLRNANNVITRTQLLNSVWNYDNEIESRTVDVHIKTLRQKLGMQGNLIQTIRGVGYTLKKRIDMKKKLSIKSEIFLSNFLMGIIISLFCSFFFVNGLYKYFENQLLKELEIEAIFLNHAIKQNGLDYFKNLKSTNRITIIEKDGNVIFDNTVNPTELKNHDSRKEVKQANKVGEGKSVRYSETMLKKTLYYAIKMDNGNILRISCNQNYIGILIFKIGEILLVMIVIALIISGVLASIFSKKITKPLSKIDIDNPNEDEIYEEIVPFVKRVTEENLEKEQREQIRRQFSANVSHELKTPLTSISGFAELLKNEDLEKNIVKDFANDIYKESQRLITLINDIIKLSRLDENTIPFDKERISLRKITQEVFGILRNAADKKNILLNLFGAQGEIYGVYHVIQEMIYNLCDNAIKYNINGGKIDVNIIENLDGIIRYSIKDTGIGISDKEKERIFERFYCVDKSRSKLVGGTGLGLSIVKHAAIYHDAKIHVESELTKGAEFIIEFAKKE